jgi:dolichyl-phosphate-mannose--protein O-mannosyl transferase
MSLFKKFNQTSSWFWIGIAGVFLLSVSLRFWGLNRFNTLVFDEVYYAIFANNYLTNTQFFDGHPPLSKYIIAIGMWIGSHVPFGQETVNGLTGSLRSPWSYRWLNALTGSFIPLVVAGIAYQLSHRCSYALIAALFAAADGLFLVESRYALNNVYLVIFGLLGQWFLLRGLERQGRQRSFWLILAGVGFGASASIKWNGLWFLLGAYFIWSAAWVIKWVFSWRNLDFERHELSGIQTYLQNLTQLKIWHILFYLAIIPALVYRIQWIPHIQLNPTFGFWEVQKQILEYHERIGNGASVHRYCSNWYSWLLMIRSVAYYYQTAQSVSEPLPVMGPPLPIANGRVIYDVHAMGNPILWWLSTAAILFLVWILAQKLLNWAIANPQKRSHSPLSTDTWIALYLVLNWLANLLPWVRVTRCTFMYHYMGASVFSGLAIAFIVDQCLHSYRREFRALGVTVIFAILLAFVFWMPIYLGLPLSPESYRLRMWFPSWI